MGSFFAGKICDLIGHRYFIFSSSLLNLIGWLCISYAIDPRMVLIGRFITGVADGFLSSAIPVYVIEIATMKCRGFLGCSFQGFITLGTLFISVCGMFVEWRLLALLCTVPAAILSVTILIFPESPYWLIKKNRHEDAMNALKTFAFK